MRTSMVANTPVEVERDGYRVIRRGGRYAVFPQVALEGLRSGGKSEDALVEIWNGMPFVAPGWSSSTTSTARCGTWCCPGAWRGSVTASSGSWPRPSTDRPT